MSSNKTNYSNVVGGKLKLKGSGGSNGTTIKKIEK